MKKIICFFWIIYFISYGIIFGQLKFRSGTFFHHSTGLCIWGPNGSSTSIPAQMTLYNNAHGLTGLNAVTMNELWFPADGDNEWCRWHMIFENEDPEANIQPYYSGNRIMVVKSCFPSSNVYGIGEPCDTSDNCAKTIFNYKWHWRHIINVMKNHPANFFVIWTNAPLVPNQTTSDEALYSHYFCKWAKDTLAQGLDPVFGTFPSNVYVFDFFHKLVGPDYMMLLTYASGPDDSHPNAAATLLVAPQFVNEIFNHSIAYEGTYGIEEENNNIGKYYLYQNYPNPFNPVTKIKFEVRTSELVKITVFDLLGREIKTLVNSRMNAGIYEYEFDASNLSSGIFFYRMDVGKFNDVKKMVIIK